MKPRLETGANAARRGYEATHAVHFYASVAELIATLTPLFVPALEKGAMCLAVATPGHLRAMESALARAGADARARQGRWETLDAEAMRSAITARGAVDGEILESRLTPLMRRRRPGQPMVIYGEIVALMCQAGRSDLALQLEDHWNLLQARYGFQLYCGYPLYLFSGGEHMKTVRAICARHNELMPPAEGVRGGPTRTGSGSHGGGGALRPVQRLRQG